MPRVKKEPLCKWGYCVKKGTYYASGDTTAFKKLKSGICPICGGATEKK